MVTKILEKSLNQKGMRQLERAFEELREEFEYHQRYMRAFLATRKEKGTSLEALAKKYNLKIPKR